MLFREMRDRYGAGSTAAWVPSNSKSALSPSTLQRVKRLREEIANGKGQKKTRALKRLKVVERVLEHDATRPCGMVLKPCR